MTSAAITCFPTKIKHEKFLLPAAEREKEIAIHLKAILEILGLDLEDPTLAKTPERVAKMYVEELFSGLDPSNFPDFEIEEHVGVQGEMVLVTKIPLISLCEHHLVPMVGVAHVAYIPNKKIIGLSKISRIVNYFAKRPQLQERLTAQIADSLSLILDTENVAVYTSARHHCMISRGVEAVESCAIMHVLRGSFLDPTTYRHEFFLQIAGGHV